VKKGNIRYIGLSNETPWGTMGFLRASNSDRPRVRTIQNPYSLLNRTFEVGNAEVCHREEVGLLAYSPLAFGVLSGKYRGGKQPEKARLTLFPHYAFMTSNIIGATDLDQLKENIGTASISLSDEILQEINSIHEAIPNPST